MGKNNFYFQCELKKKIDDTSYLTDVAWIQERFAKVGKQVKIKQENGTWDYGWQVTYVGAKQKADLVEARERDYLNQRKVSDI
jgi:hypothetical protein